MSTSVVHGVNATASSSYPQNFDEGAFNWNAQVGNWQTPEPNATYPEQGVHGVMNSELFSPAFSSSIDLLRGEIHASASSHPYATPVNKNE